MCDDDDDDDDVVVDDDDDDDDGDDDIDCPPTRWPQSPRIAAQCTPKAANGPDHPGFGVLTRATAPSWTRAHSTAEVRISRVRVPTAVSETVARLHPPLPSVDFLMWMERERVGKMAVSPTATY